MSDDNTVADSGASEEVAESVDQSQQDDAQVAVSQRSVETPSKQETVDLSNNPQFRQMQSEYQSRIDNLANQVEALSTRDMSDEELAKFQDDKTRQAIYARDERIAELESSIERDRVLNELAGETGVPFEVVKDATSPVDAAMRAAKYLKTQVGASTVNVPAAPQLESDDVIVGGGGAASTSGDVEKKFKEAFRKGAATDYVKLLDSQ